jgi:starch synthase
MVLLASQAAHLVLISSFFEPSGIIQQEAFASGMPAVALRTGGLADTVFEFDSKLLNGNGFTFSAHAHDDYVMAIERALRVYSNSDLYFQLRKNAYDSVLSTETVALASAQEFYRLFHKIYGELIGDE